MKNSRSKWVTLAVLVSVAVMGCKSDTEEKKENLISHIKYILDVGVLIQLVNTVLIT